jgi:cytoskeleton protein RodZ
MARGNFGERLKRERELREVTLAEITAATRIGPRFLEALENEDWAKLPGGVFNRGFVRSIARYLGLDEEGLLGDYDLAHAAHLSPAQEKPENRIPPPPRWLPFAAVLGFLALLAGLIFAGIYGWRKYQEYRARKAAAPAALLANRVALPGPTVLASSVPSARAQSPPDTAALEPLQLLVSLGSATRVRIIADGKLMLDAELASGENRHFTAREKFEVFAANSSAVLLELNGRAMPPLGAPGASGTITLDRKDLK